MHEPYSQDCDNREVSSVNQVFTKNTEAQWNSVHAMMLITEPKIKVGFFVVSDRSLGYGDTLLLIEA